MEQKAESGYKKPWKTRWQQRQGLRLQEPFYLSSIILVNFKIFAEKQFYTADNTGKFQNINQISILLSFENVLTVLIQFGFKEISLGNSKVPHNSH